MMKPVVRVDANGASATLGKVVFDPQKAAWSGGLILAGAALAPLYFSWSAVAAFVLLTYVTMLLGHSVGMHRMMIHRTFSCPKWLERALIYIGVLVGMAGPFGVIKVHDTRDWAQRQAECHDFFSHERGFLRDVTWQLFYRFEFARPPHITIEKDLYDDPFYAFLDKTWALHQVALAGLLFWLGGMPWLVWGVCLRVPLSIVGHWAVTYYCHNPGPGKWRVRGACVQASNLPFMGVLTHGECWHNNHHAFPESAQIGLQNGQIDPAWLVIRCLAALGLASNIGRPRVESEREDLLEVGGR